MTFACVLTVSIAVAAGLAWGDWRAYQAEVAAMDREVERSAAELFAK